MNTSNVLFVFLVVVLIFAGQQETAHANEIRIGDSRDGVVEALGEPQGVTTFTDIEVLYYPRGKIEIESGHVVSHNLISPEELEILTEKRLMEEEARREREVLRREQQAEDEELAILQDNRSVPPKGDHARDIYKIGTSNDTHKNASLSSTYKAGSMNGTGPVRLTDWKKSKYTPTMPYVVVKQGEGPNEMALYKKDPQRKDETHNFNVRRQDQNKTLTLHTQYSGDDPKYWLEFNGNGEVPVYNSKDGSKAPDWSYLVKRYRNEKENRLYVYYATNIHQPTAIIETDPKTGMVGIFRTNDSRRPQRVPVRVYDPSRCIKLHPDAIRGPFSDEVIAILATMHVLQRR